MGCHFLLQGIIPTQGSNLCLLHWQADSLPLSHLGSPSLLNAWMHACSSQLNRPRPCSAVSSLLHVHCQDILRWLWIKHSLLVPQSVHSTWLDALSLSIRYPTYIYWASTMQQALCFEFFQWFNGYTHNINSQYLYTLSLALLSKGIFWLQLNLWSSD